MHTPAHFRAKHACLKASQDGMGSLTGTGRAKQSKSKDIMFLRTVRRQSTSRRPCYCLYHDIKAPTLNKGSHGEKAHPGTPADCLSFLSWFLLYFVSIRFDNVISIPCYLFFYREATLQETSALPWTLSAGNTADCLKGSFPLGFCCLF